MSRLELGPEDNPNYVVDENQSGDLEVRDADGNVIATYTQDQTTEVQTLTTESLVDALDGQQWETLKAAGFNEGDKVPIIESTCLSDTDYSISSTSWAQFNAGVPGRVAMDPRVFSIPQSKLYARMQFQTWGNQDTGDYRLSINYDTGGGSTDYTDAVTEDRDFKVNTTGWVSIDKEAFNGIPEGIVTSGTNIGIANVLVQVGTEI